MASNSVFDPFKQVDLGQFFTIYQDWILFALLLFFFWAVVGIALKKKFEESRYLRTLITVIALMFSIGTFYSVYKGWLHLNLEGLGFLGVLLIFIVIFFVVYGMMRGYQVSKTKAMAIGYLLLFLSLHAVSPSLFDTLAGFFPLGNLILIIIFLASLFVVIISVFKIFGSHTRHLDHAKSVLKKSFTSADDVEMEREIEGGKKEIKLLKGKTLRLTQTELKTIDHVENNIRQMIDIIRHDGSNLTQEDKTELTASLQMIKKNENILWRALELLEKHVYVYHNKGKKDLINLQQKLKKNQNKKQRTIIESEITYQKRMQQALAYLEKYQTKIAGLIRSFNRFIDLSIERLRTGYNNDAVQELERAHRNIYDLKHIYAEQKSLEKYILNLEKKTVGKLKKEKAA